TDCEGFGENFQVTTLLGKEKRGVDHVDGIKLETIKSSIQEKGKKIESLKRSESNKELLAAAVQDLKKTTQLATLLEAEHKEKPENTST
ncbi:hypothetical protein PSY31_23095, partial [Shigella flexneri]|nr:hypothetical protein [Shigella flexneri]